MKQVESTWACLKGAFMSIYSSVSTGVYMIHSSKQSLFISKYIQILIYEYICIHTYIYVGGQQEVIICF